MLVCVGVVLAHPQRPDAVVVADVRAAIEETVPNPTLCYVQPVVADDPLAARGS